MMRKARIRIDTNQVIGKIDSHIYGHFIEFLGRCINDGLWAEMLRNRKFEAQDNNKDGVSNFWFPVGNRKYINYHHDDKVYFSPGHSQRIEILGNNGKRGGIRQSKIPLKAEKSYTVSFYVKGKEVKGEIEVSLQRRDGEKNYAFQAIPIKGSFPWKRCSFFLRPNVDYPEACFVIMLKGKGTIWLDSLSLMPTDNISGMHKDVVDMTKAISPSNIRFPGGCYSDGYHWMNAIGPRDKRPAIEDFVQHYAKKIPESNDFGIDEFMKFCQLVGSEAYIGVNFGSGTPQEAANWVEYCNGDSKETLLGKKRASNGHTQPYGVKLWGIGNEIWGDWEIGHCDAETYARKFIEFHDAMKAVDPTIKLVAAGTMYDVVNGKIIPTATNSSWNKKVLEIAGDYIDYLSVHYYVPKPPGLTEREKKSYSETKLYQAIVAAPQDLENKIKELRLQIQEIIKDPGKVKIILDEWAVQIDGFFGLEGERGEGKLLEEKYQLRDALFVAGVLNALQRLSKEESIRANYALMINVMGCINTKYGVAYPSAIYPVFLLYTQNTENSVLKVESESETMDTPEVGFIPHLRVPYLDCSANLSLDKKRLSLFVVNRHPENEIETEIDLASFVPKNKAKIWEINAPYINSMNNLQNPENVGISKSEISLVSSHFLYKFPAHSITAIMLSSV